MGDCKGEDAVLLAMAGDPLFPSLSESAAELLMQGSLCCDFKNDELDTIVPKETVVQLLSHMAEQGIDIRRLPHLSSLLAQGTVKYQAFHAGGSTPSTPLEVFAVDEALWADAAASKKVCDDALSSSKVPLDVSPRCGDVCVGPLVASEEGSLSHDSAPAHGARVFLWDRLSRRHLTVAQSPEGVDRIVMTRRAASLFVCHRNDDVVTHPAERCVAMPHGTFGDCGVGVELADSYILSIARADLAPERASERPSSRTAQAPDAVLSFAHEGLPALGSFLTGYSRWWWEPRTGASDMKLQCAGKSPGPPERFRWLDDGAIQHVASGMWLHVDPASPDEVMLHATERSYWEALSAI